MVQIEEGERKCRLLVHGRTLRARLVRGLKRRGIRDRRVLRAFARVPRELFVPLEQSHLAYDDRPLPIGSGQTISQPYIVAVMLEALGLKGGERVLEVGAGSGYAAALLSAAGADVHAIERLPDLAARARKALDDAGFGAVSLVCADGSLGLPEAAPFDAILISAAAPEIPKALRDQLAVGGRLVAPVGARESVQRLIRLTQTSADAVLREELCPVQFVPLLVGADQR